MGIRPALPLPAGGLVPVPAGGAGALSTSRCTSSGTGLLPQFTMTAVAGVDHINTDDLAGLRAFLLANDPAERARG
ncbi:hypothetical protein [Lentzea sp. HUAS12]|uniref:hypothetical protein n=1 Tax=Lentzea sp. HUAS12 TaxID=2951806 RepID=UPI00209E9C1A|nr:hypothetical protein [Lentzea sp. HUAS12]USX55535.1 hypothetical protein ND450_15965 [Lentzea sp. HUAS12]